MSSPRRDRWQSASAGNYAGIPPVAMPAFRRDRWQGASLLAIHRPLRQNGAALFVSLALLLALSIIGVSAVRSAILQERMTRNAWDGLLAFQAAEAALLEGERHLVEQVRSTEPFTDAGSAGLWTASAAGDAERWALPGVWDAHGGRSLALAQTLDGVARQPRFILEWLATARPSEQPHLLQESTVGGEQVEIFRITALGFGATPNTRAMLQSTFGLAL